MDDFIITAERDGAGYIPRWRNGGGRLEKLATHDGTPIAYPTAEAAELAAARELLKELNGAAVPQTFVMRQKPPEETAPKAVPVGKHRKRRVEVNFKGGKERDRVFAKFR